MKLTNKHNLPETIVNVIKRPTYSKGKANMSVTELLNSPRIVQLKRKHWDDLTEDASDMVWSIFGTAIHGVLEHGKDDHHVVEERIHATIGGMSVSGAMDLQEIEEDGIILSDYKTTSAYSIVYNPEGKPEWIKQMNIYAYLLEEAGFPVKGLKIIAILRDHNSAKAADGGNYPPIPIHILNSPKWDKSEAEAYIKERVALFQSAKGLEDDALPPCTPEEMWEKAGSWAVMKPGRKTAVAVCDSEGDAAAKCAPGCSVVYRPGVRNRCEGYCPVSNFCNIYKKYKGEI